MAVGNRPWCDFVIYTTKGVSVERIHFDTNYWSNTLLLIWWIFNNCLGPEITSLLHALGIPMCNFNI